MWGGRVRVRVAGARSLRGGLMVRAGIWPAAAVIAMLAVGLAVKSAGKYGVASDGAASQADAALQPEPRGTPDFETSDPKIFVVPASLDTSLESAGSPR